tara:strand:- start:193362 stop:193988 length:627 start_codon:yes stop_codon:yes gene_type:complete
MKKDNNKALQKFNNKLDKIKIKQDDKFEIYYSNLYNNLHKRYEVEFESIIETSSKIEFLSKLMDEIITANHDAENNKILSPLVENYKINLLGLFKVFDFKIQELNFPTNAKLEKNKENEGWFKTGIYLANGEAYKLNKLNLSRTEIALKLGFKKTDGVYFSESIGNNSNHVKNLYRTEKKYKYIYNYCKKNKIEMCEDFLREGKTFRP